VNRCRPPGIVREAVAALAERGHAVDVDVAGSGHIKISWEAGGRRVLFIVARNPGDRRADANARSTLRRLLREEGA
jgi:hypothetical protein